MIMSQLKKRSLHFSKDSKGAVAIIVAFSILPVMLMAGMAADYTRALAVKARLDSAADAAALASINSAQASIIGSSQSNPNPTAIAAGVAQGQKAFAAQASLDGQYTTATPTVNVTINGPTITGTVNYAASTSTYFGRLASTSNFPIAGSSTAFLTMGKYLDFYLLLDVSGSMGIPSTDSGQTALAAINPDNKSAYPGGCVFACHFAEKNMCSGSSANGVCQGFNLARTNNIQLRADAVGSAVVAMIQSAQSTATIPNQYRMGIYPFIDHANTLTPLSSNLTTVSNAIGYNAANNSTTLGNLLDTGNSTLKLTSSDTYSIGSGGTHFENIFSDISSLISSVGNGGSSTNTQPFVFLVTDGADNNQTYTTSNNSWTGSQPQLMNPANCKTLTDRGITLAVLYIPYVPIQNPTSFAGNEDYNVNAIVPSIPSTLQQCASPGFFWTANAPADITSAMQAMFAQSLQSAMISK